LGVQINWAQAQFLYFLLSLTGFSGFALGPISLTGLSLTLTASFISSFSPFFLSHLSFFWRSSSLLPSSPCLSFSSFFYFFPVPSFLFFLYLSVSSSSFLPSFLLFLFFLFLISSLFFWQRSEREIGERRRREGRG
jgi:hypothetical protein